MELTTTEYKVGPLLLLTLDQPTHHFPVLRCDGAQRTAVVLGNPSLPASTKTSLEMFLTEALDRGATLDSLKSQLQGDFVLILLDSDQQSWEISPDATGMGRLFLFQSGSSFLAAGAQYLLAASVPLRLDVVACHTLDLAEYLYGERTIFEGVRYVQMNEKLAGTVDHWRILSSLHYIDMQGAVTTPDDVADAYLDAFAGRYPTGLRVRSCTTGGVDSRVILGLLHKGGLRPVVFIYRWDKDDTRVAQEIAHELDLDFLSTSRLVPLHPDPARETLAEAFVLDGMLRVPFTKRNYLFDTDTLDLLTTGNYADGITRTCWGIGYKGMPNPTPERIIHRMTTLTTIRKHYQVDAFPTDPLPGVVDLIRQEWRKQADLVSGAHPTKLMNYLYLRSRASHMSGTTRASSSHWVRTEYPASLVAGVASAWRIPHTLYKNLELSRRILHRMHPNLTHPLFADNTPATLDYKRRERLLYFYNRVYKKVKETVEVNLMGKPQMIQLGTLYNSRMSHPQQPPEPLPAWVSNDRERRTGGVYKPVGDHFSRLHHVHRKVMFSLEFACRVYDGAMI